MLTQFKRYPLYLIAPALLLLAAVFWNQPKETTLNTNPSIHHRQAQTQTDFSVSDGGDERRPPDKRRGCHRKRGHHGPPHGVPPTVLFLIGGALGFLIGCKKKRRGHHRAQHGPCCQPPQGPPAHPEG